MSEIQVRLRRLERKEWVLWWSAIAVMILLSLALGSFSLPHLGDEADWFREFALSQASRGLLAVVLLFSTYVIHQQFFTKGLRRQLAEQMEVAARLEARAEELQKLALMDPLTGLYNRRFAEHHLVREMARAERHGSAFSVLALDLNGFKQINDRLGHLAGDHVLQAFAARLQQKIRAVDSAIRMGGDEFLVLLPDCNHHQVHGLVQRLEDLRVEIEDGMILVRFAAGWTSHRPGDTVQSMLERADHILYANKRVGSNHPPALCAAAS